jgi:hypothetical protein
VNPSKRSVLHSHYVPPFGPIGAYAYIVGFTLPLQGNIPLLGLVLMGGCAAVLGARDGLRPSWTSLGVPMLGFLTATGLSILVSEDVGRSMRLSAALLPAALLFLVIADHFQAVRDVRRLYLTFTAVALGLAVLLLWHVGQRHTWLHGIQQLDMRALMQEVGSPILLVPNDATFLAVIGPLSLVLLVGKPWSPTGGLAALSLLASVCIVVMLRSRTAMLAMVISLACTSALIRPRRRLAFGLACGLTSLFLALLVDWFFAFPLMSKFIRQWYGSGRIALWLATWAMFLDAPWLGHGPHTFVLRYQAYLSDLGLPSSSVIIPWAHNLYLEVLAEQGIIGFTALGVLLARGLSMAWRTQRAASAEARLLGAGVFGGLIGLCGAAAVELTLLREWVVVMLFTFLGISAYLTSSRSTEGRVSE